jgi:hypothetical protein
MPAMKEIAVQGSPVSSVTTFKKDGNTYHHYDCLDIDGFIAMGDSLCNFNPTYGQGQTVASEAALQFDTLLRKGTYFILST